MAARTGFEEGGGGESLLRPSSAAALRLAALSQHLDPVPSPSSLTREACFARVERPASSGGRGSLKVVDSRTGKSYEFEINEGGTVKATDFKKVIIFLLSRIPCLSNCGMQLDCSNCIHERLKCVMILKYCAMRTQF